MSKTTIEIDIEEVAQNQIYALENKLQKADRKIKKLEDQLNEARKELTKFRNNFKALVESKYLAEDLVQKLEDSGLSIMLDDARSNGYC